MLQWTELIPATASDVTEYSSTSSGSYSGFSSVISGIPDETDTGSSASTTITNSAAGDGAGMTAYTQKDGFYSYVETGSIHTEDNLDSGDITHTGQTVYSDYNQAYTNVRYSDSNGESVTGTTTTFESTFATIKQTSTNLTTSIFGEYSATTHLDHSAWVTGITGTVLTSMSGTSEVTYNSTTSTVFYSTTSTTFSSSSLGSTIGTTSFHTTLPKSAYWVRTLYLAEAGEVGYSYPVGDGDQLSVLSAGSLFTSFTALTVVPSVQAVEVEYTLINTSATVSYSTATAIPPDSRVTYHGTTGDTVHSTTVTNSDQLPMGTATVEVTTQKLTTLTASNDDFPINTYGDSFNAPATVATTIGASWIITATTTLFLVSHPDGRGTTTDGITTVQTSSSYPNAMANGSTIGSHEDATNVEESDHTDNGIDVGAGGQSVTYTYGIGCSSVSPAGSLATIHSAQGGGYKLPPHIDTSDSVAGLYLSINHTVYPEIYELSRVMDFGGQSVLVSGQHTGNIIGSDGTSGYNFAASWSQNSLSLTVQNWTRSDTSTPETVAVGSSISFSDVVSTFSAQPIGLATAEVLYGFPREDIDLPFIAGGHHPHHNAVDSLYITPGFYEITNETGTAASLKQSDSSVAIATNHVSAIAPRLAFAAETVVGGGSNVIILVETRNEQP